MTEREMVEIVRAVLKREGRLAARDKAIDLAEEFGSWIRAASLMTAAEEEN